jgi:hypothetical protein
MAEHIEAFWKYAIVCHGASGAGKKALAIAEFFPCWQVRVLSCSYSGFHLTTFHSQAWPS